MDAVHSKVASNIEDHGGLLIEEQLVPLVCKSPAMMALQAVKDDAISRHGAKQGH